MTSIAGVVSVAVALAALLQMRIEVAVGIVALLLIVPVGNKLTRVRRYS